MNNRRRQLRQGASYDISCKINRDEIIFANDIISKLLLEIIERCMKKYSFSIENFCIRENYVLFILHPKGNSSLPRIMQWINSVFAKTYNKKMGISGRLWKERYSSRIIETAEEFVQAFERIVKNPLMANIVKKAKDYRWCGLYYYQHGIEGIIKHRGRFISALYEHYRSL
jgi:REP element-mobilizing transposase RayT